MPSMSYCIIENTSGDLVGCEESLDDGLNEMSEYELRSIKHLIKTCKRIVEKYDDDDFLAQVEAKLKEVMK